MYITLHHTLWQKIKLVSQQLCKHNKYNIWHNLASHLVHLGIFLLYCKALINDWKPVRYLFVSCLLDCYNLFFSLLSILSIYMSCSAQFLLPMFPKLLAIIHLLHILSFSSPVLKILKFLMYVMAESLKSKSSHKTTKDDEKLKTLKQALSSRVSNPSLIYSFMNAILNPWLDSKEISVKGPWVLWDAIKGFVRNTTFFFALPSLNDTEKLIHLIYKK